MAQDTGGPAFPTDKQIDYFSQVTGKLARTDVMPDQPGMTLLDWFAGQAMAGLQANPSLDMSHGQTAICAYDAAEAMITEKREGEE